MNTNTDLIGYGVEWSADAPQERDGVVACRGIVRAVACCVGAGGAPRFELLVELADTHALVQLDPSERFVRVRRGDGFPTVPGSDLIA